MWNVHSYGLSNVSTPETCAAPRLGFSPDLRLGFRSAWDNFSKIPVLATKVLPLQADYVSLGKTRNGTVSEAVFGTKSLGEVQYCRARKRKRSLQRSLRGGQKGEGKQENGVKEEGRREHPNRSHWWLCSQVAGATGTGWWGGRGWQVSGGWGAQVIRSRTGVLEWIWFSDTCTRCCPKSNLSGKICGVTGNIVQSQANNAKGRKSIPTQSLALI